ncbi:MFS transporter [Pseudomonas capeferrum]|uniref:MFS transporter n=1 Tax=Pseudomonas capeferrum TaxID=1495066 RepID=UPI0015E3CB39|nr:MFS transporter [Pseudomonas capeferrum]MBA1200956.1 MFS transporter [Pseudomonas capeferrum]
MANAYREILLTPNVKGLLMTATIVRLPQTMIGIGLLTMLVQQSAGYWLAGAIAGTYTLATAFVGPRISRLVDRHGQSRVLPIVSAFSVAMLLTLLAAAHVQAPSALLFILAALAGTMPSMSVMARARWAKIFRGKPLLHAAITLDTVLAELAYIAGPPLAIALSMNCFAEAGPLAAVALLTVGVTVFVLQRQTEPEVVARTTTATGSAMRLPGLRVLVMAMVAMGLIGGAVDVAVVAFATAEGSPTTASWILAAYALGSVSAGLVFGALTITAPIERQFLIALILLAVTAVLPMFSANVYIMTGMIFVAGMSFAPTIAIVMNLGTHIVPAAELTEGLTWMSTGIGIGIALGGACAGLVIDTLGARAGFGVAIVAGLALVAIATIGQRSLRAESAMPSALRAV